MLEIESSLKKFPVTSYAAGDILLTQGEKTDNLYFLLDGEVRVVKDGIEVAYRAQKGSVFGEMSVMLDKEHTATVICVTACKFYCVDSPKKALANNPEVIWHIGKILSLRLDGLNKYLVGVKSRLEDQVANDIPLKEKSAGREKMINEILQLLQVQ